MEILIKNEIEINELIVNLYDKNLHIKKSIKIRSNRAMIDVDILVHEYLTINYLDKESEIIRLSKNIFSLVLKNNERLNKTHIELDIEYEKDYGTVHNFTLSDEKNLYFRDDKKKNINVLLPKDYDETKKYGLLIMFDSQNIYNQNKVDKYSDKSDPYGGIEVETTLSTIKKLFNREYIVLGIENADIYRDQELTPSTGNVKFKNILYELNEEGLLNGKLDDFHNFINETLLPFIFAKYPINQNEIGIAGASSGGLASFYIGLKDYEKYKFIFTFSPATGFIEDETLDEIYKKIDFIKNIDKLPYIFYYQGNKGELEEMLYNVNINFITLLKKNNYPLSKIDEYVLESGDHNEEMWRYAFNYAFYKYLAR